MSRFGLEILRLGTQAFRCSFDIGLALDIGLGISRLDRITRFRCLSAICLGTCLITSTDTIASSGFIRLRSLGIAAILCFNGVGTAGVRFGIG